MTSVTAIEAILFDYGLVLSGPPDPAAWTRMLRITGLDEASFQQAYWAPRHAYDRGTHTGEGYWREVARTAGVELGPGDVVQLVDADVALWTQVNQPMIDWALRLQAAGIRTGILSNIGDAMEHGIVRKFAWLQGFHFMLWSHRLKLAKPELEIYRHAAAGLGVGAEHILFIDDRVENVAGAVAAGMQGIRYTTQEEFQKTLGLLGLSGLWHPRLNRETY